MFCPNCGTQNDDGVRFCANCGNALTPNVNAAPQPMPAAAPAPAPVTPVAPAPQPMPAAAPITAIPSQKTNGLCIAGLIVSLVSIPLLGTTAIIGLILSVIGLIVAGKKNEKGKGQAVAGIIISAILVLVWIIALIYGFGAAKEYRKNYVDRTSRTTTTEYDETTRRTTRETTEDTEATTEETTRETPSETSASASKNGAWETSVGNDKTGKIALTSGRWAVFHEAGGFSNEVIEHEQVQDLDTASIIGLFVLNVNYSAEDLAKSQMYSMEKAGAQKVTGAKVKLGGYDAIQCYGMYPDGMILVVWFFKGDDGQMRKITVEFPSDKYSVFEMVEKGYKLDR